MESVKIKAMKSVLPYGQCGQLLWSNNPRIVHTPTIFSMIACYSSPVLFVIQISKLKNAEISH